MCIKIAKFRTTVRKNRWKWYFYEKAKYKTIEEKIDQAIYESEKEVDEGTKPILFKEAKKKLDDEFYGKSIKSYK